MTTAVGKVSKADFMAHIEQVWGDPAVAGFDELIDVSQADLSALSTEDIAGIVKSGVSVDLASPSKLALCVSTELSYGLGRMYGSMRESNTDNEREVKVFSDLASARAWLE